MHPDAIPWRTDFVVPVQRRVAPAKDSALALAERLALQTGAKLVTTLVQSTPLPDGAPDSIGHLLRNRDSRARSRRTPISSSMRRWCPAPHSPTCGATSSRRAAKSPPPRPSPRGCSPAVSDPTPPHSPRSSAASVRSSISCRRNPGFALEQLTHKESLLLSGLTTLEVFRNPRAPTHRIVQMALGTPY